MIRVVLDTNAIVSAQLKPTGLEATVLLLALRGDIALFVSPPKFDPRRVEAVLLDIGAASQLVHPARTLADAKHEPDNRFLECAEAACADFLVTGNKRHFPKDWRPSKIVNAREFIDQTALLDFHNS